MAAEHRPGLARWAAGRPPWKSGSSPARRQSPAERLVGGRDIASLERAVIVGVAAAGEHFDLGQAGSAATLMSKSAALERSRAAIRSGLLSSATATAASALSGRRQRRRRFERTGGLQPARCSVRARQSGLIRLTVSLRRVTGATATGRRQSVSGRDLEGSEVAWRLTSRTWTLFRLSPTTASLG